MCVKWNKEGTVVWEMFVVKIFSWGRRTMEIKRTNIFLQDTLRVLNYRGFARTMKISLHENLAHENISHETFPNYGMSVHQIKN